MSAIALSHQRLHAAGHKSHRTASSHAKTVAAQTTRTSLQVSPAHNGPHISRGVCTDRETDQALLIRVQAGDHSAFERLMNKYQSRILQIVQRFVGEADAPDVAQESFIKAYRSLKGFRGESSFYTWLYRIAINCAKNHLVSRSRRPVLQDLDVADAEKFGNEEYLSDVGTPEAYLLAEEVGETLAGAMKTLPTDLRGAITLREFEGLSYEDIAQEMRCPIGTVRSRIFRARAMIDTALSPLLA